jgi:hypothetical protein
MNPVALALDRHIVAVEVLALIQMLTLHEALYRGGVVAVPGVKVAKPHHQGIL